jgi:hypothetical protein
MNAFQDQTEETLSAIAKAQTAGILESTGVYSYDLSDLVSLIPVVTPFRDRVARKVSTDGNPFAVWRALMNINASQPDLSMGFDFAANEVNFQEQDFQARYKPTGLAGIVTQDSVDMAKGYADPYAVATFQVLNQVLIGDDRKLLGAQSFALAQPGTVTAVTSTTGGSIAASTTNMVAVAARTGSGYYYGTGNSQGKASSAVTTTGSTSTITASCAAVKGAVAYDWFYSSNSGTTWFYAGTTTVASFTFSATLAANAALPLTQPDLSTSWKGVANSVPTVNTAADNGSANPNDYDGFLASCTGDWTNAGLFATSGTANANQAIFQDGGGAALALAGGSVAQIENQLFLPLWNSVKCSPTALMMNAAQAQEIANLILGGSSATTFLNTDASGRVSVTAGGRVGEIVNAPAGGVTVPIEVHVSIPPGTIIARSDRVPFPQSNISNVLEYRAVRDTAQFDYGVSRVANTLGGGPRKEFEIRSVGSFVNRAPVAQGILANIA